MQSGYTFSRGQNITNIACVTGTDLAGVDVSDCDDAEVLTVGINMEKTVDQPIVCNGDDVTFTLVTRMINGSPNVQFRNVVVTDPLCPNLVFVGGDLNNNGALDFGEEFTNTCTMAATASFVNVATDAADVYFNNEFRGMVTNMDEVAVTVLNPGIVVTVDKPTQTVPVGNSADFMVTVTNTGDVPMENVQITHSALPACNVTIPIIAVNGSVSRICTVPAVTSAIDDQISVAGSSATGCTAAAAANARIEPMIMPDIVIEKTVYLGHDAGVGCPTAGELVTELIGRPITYCFVVRNTGNTILDINLTDADLGITDTNMTLIAGSSPLAPNETISFYYETTLNGNLINTACVEGVTVDAAGLPIPDVPVVDDCDTAETRIPPSGDVTISGSVFFDGNCDGTYQDLVNNPDSGEFGFTNVTVTLIRNGTPFFATQTDDDGDYAFDIQSLGSYVVVVTLGDVPSPYFIGGTFLVTNDLANPYVANDINDTFVDIDFGFQAGTITGTVWKDVDSNGVINENVANPQIAFNGVVVDLLNSANVVVATTVTANRPNSSDVGFYSFDKLTFGTYNVRVADSAIRTVLAAAGDTQDFRATTTPAPVVIDGANCDGEMNFGFIASPTAIKLAAFSCQNGPAGVLVRWTTGSEINNFGFNVYRSERINGVRTRVNDRMIGALNVSSGGDYSMVDTSATAGRCYYWLEDVDYTLGATLHGPVVLNVENATQIVAAVAVTQTGIVKVTDATLAAAGLVDYDQITILIDGIEVPALVADSVDHILFFVPEGAEKIEFGLSASPKRMDVLDLSSER